MNARFASRCPNCLQPINVGDAINWTKGQPATHTMCMPVDPNVRQQHEQTAKQNLIAALTWLTDRETAGTIDDFERSFLVQWREKRRLSEKQVACIIRAIEREKPATQTPTAPTQLLPAGRYAVQYQGQWRFIRIWRGSRNPNVQHVYEVHGTEKGVRITPDPALMAAIAQDPMKAAVDFGHRFGHCGRCGLALDVNLTRFMGIGPVCIKHYDEAGRLDRINDARNILYSVGIDPTGSNDDLAAAFAAAA